MTSSYAAMVDYSKPITRAWTEADWNPITEAQAYTSPQSAYLASKTFAERAAWDFVARQKPGFALTTMNPAMVYGPVLRPPPSLSAINTSNARFAALLLGGPGTPCPPTVNYLFVDVRDLALAHVLALRKPVGGHRFLVTAGNYCNADIARVIGEEFPEFRARMPTGEALRSGEAPEDGGVNGFDNSKSVEVLGMRYRGFREAVVGVVESVRGLL